ncbi:hypothetical protein ES703_99841 [subsurface metagenome]
MQRLTRLRDRVLPTVAIQTLVAVTIYAENALDPYSRYWRIYKNGAVVKQITAHSGYTWSLNLEAGTYEFGVSQAGGPAYGTYSGTINGMPFSGVDIDHNVAFTVGAPPPPPPSEAVLSVSPTTVAPRGSYTFTVSGFIDGRGYVYLDFLSGPPEVGPYPRAVYRFPAAASGSYTTNAPSVEGTYVARARQGTLLSNTATFTVTAAAPPPPGADGKIIEIKVHNAAKNLWFTWADGAWDSPPAVTPGRYLFIWFYVENRGTAGNLTLTIKDDTGATLATKTEYTYAGSKCWCATDIIYMPDRSYGIDWVATP